MRRDRQLGQLGAGEAGRMRAAVVGTGVANESSRLSKDLVPFADFRSFGRRLRENGRFRSFTLDTHLIRCG